MKELEVLGVAFVAPGQIDMSMPMGWTQAHLLSAVAEFEKGAYSGTSPLGPGQCSGHGKRLGHPNATPLLVNKGLPLMKLEMTYQQAAEYSGVSISTLLRD